MITNIIKTEYGLEWTICDGKILYVGSFESEDVEKTFEEEYF